MNPIDSRLLDILVCPICKGPLKALKRSDDSGDTPAGVDSELFCHADKLAFPIKDGIARMLVDEARVING